MTDPVEFAAVLAAAVVLIHYTGWLFWRLAYDPDPECVRYAEIPKKACCDRGDSVERPG